MTDAQLMQIADAADLIVNGYAFAKESERIRILNLNNPGRKTWAAKSDKGFYGM